MRSDFNGSGRAEAVLPPPLPLRRPTANEWLPPRDFLPPESATVPTSTWMPWVAAPGPPPRPRGAKGPCLGSALWSPQQTLDAWTAGRASYLVYASMDELAAAWHARLATLVEMPEFRAKQRDNPEFKPRLSGLLWMAHGPRRIRVLLDTSATHCFRSSPVPAWLLRSIFAPGVRQGSVQLRD